MQQLKALILKRFRIFKKRYLIALFALFLPLVIESVLSSIIPSTSSVIEDAFNTLFNILTIPKYNLNIANYGAQTFPYTIFGHNEHERENLNDFFMNFSKANNRMSSGIKYLELKDESVNDYVYKKRVSSVSNILNDYFVGLSFDLQDANAFNKASLSISIFFSSLAFHSEASILNEVNSFMLGYLTNNVNRKIITTNAPISVKSNKTSEVNLDQLQVLSCVEAMPFSYIDFINSIIISFIISVTTIHLTREKRNGSKSLQLLSGTHFIVYWIANYLFDLVIFLFNIVTIVVSLKIVALSITDKANDTFLIAHDGMTLFNFFLFMLLTCLSWSTLAYVWSNFFKSDIIGFVVLLITLSFAAFADIIMVYVKFFDRTTSLDMEDGFLGSLINLLRTLLVILFPNLAVKRALFNLKIQNLPICLALLNPVFNSNFLKLHILCFII